MAFGIKKDELNEWKSKVRNGEIAFLTHYWLIHHIWDKHKHYHQLTHHNFYNTYNPPPNQYLFNEILVRLIK